MPTKTEIAQLFAAAADVRRQGWQDNVEAGSPVANELHSALEELHTDEPIRRLVVLADLWTMVASDQLGAMATVVASERNLLGVFPIARSIVEHSAAVLWVLCPQLTTPSRGARAALAARKSADEACAAMAHLCGKGSSEHVQARTALKDLRASLIQEFGLETGEENDILGESLASPTEMVSEVGAISGDATRVWQGIYDYLCATANHPTLRVFDFIDREGTIVSLNVSDAFLDRLARACLAVYLSALDATMQYFGWNTDAVDRFYEHVESVLPSPPGAT